MKQYYTLATKFDIDQNASLAAYFKEQGIEYEEATDVGEDLRQYGYQYRSSPVAPVRLAPDSLVKLFVVLIEEHEKSAICLRFDNMLVIRNRGYYNFINWIRRTFRVFFA